MLVRKQSLLITMFIAMLCLFTLGSGLAETAKPLSVENEKVLDDVRFLAGLLPFENQNPDNLKRQLLNQGFVLTKDEINSLGVRHIEFQKGNDEFYRLIFEIEDNMIAAYQVHLTGWYYVGDQAAIIWAKHGGPPFDNGGSLRVLAESKMRTELQDIYALEQFAPLEQHSPEVLKQILLKLGYKVTSQKSDKFGYTSVELTKMGKYKKIRIAFEIFDKEYMSFVNKVINKLYPSYKTPQGEAMSEMIVLDATKVMFDPIKDDVMGKYLVFKNVENKYLQRVAMGVLDLKNVTTPREDLERYATAVSGAYPYLYFNEGDDCEYNRFDGIHTLKKDMADNVIFFFEENEKFDVLESILYGFDSFARVYAIKALERAGLAANPKHQAQIAKILSDPTPIKICNPSLTVRELEALSWDDRDTSYKSFTARELKAELDKK